MRAKLAFVTRISGPASSSWATGGKPHELPTADEEFILCVSCHSDEQGTLARRLVGAQLRFVAL